MKNASVGFLFCILLIAILFFNLKIPKENEPEKVEPLTILNTETGEIFEMDKEEYVWRSMAREMPYSFHEEALKAQAVAIRSYISKKVPSSEHKGAILCTSPDHCAAFLTDDKDFDPQGREILKKAVRDTKGEMLYYEGEVADAVFFAMSCGRTENSEDVWQKEVPYLRSVDCHWDKNEETFKSVVDFSEEELKTKLKVENFKVGTIEKTEAGSVKSVEIDGKIFKGSTVRSLLNLRSSCFEIEGQRFTVYGYGHGVGMSQRGANSMAKEGASYREILSHFYPGTYISIEKD